MMGKWMWRCRKLVLILSVLQGHGTRALSVKRSKQHADPKIGLEQPHRVVIVGKVIIDEYCAPDDDPFKAVVSIGGGGPQAAWGAAAALAVLHQYKNDETAQDPPPPQHVSFFGPVGQVDWTEREDEALRRMLEPAVDDIRLIPGPSLRTPRIQLWHDEEQNVQWKTLLDSFGPDGADGLWRNRPSADDVLQALGEDEIITSLHVIMEAGAKAAGDGYDAMLLSDMALLDRTRMLGVEPITFPNDSTGEVSPTDAQCCALRLNQFSSSLNCVSPDIHLYRAMDPSFWQKWDNVAIRNGPDGSLFLGESVTTTIAAATLLTSDGKPVNPTGAGNAYAAAFTACLGTGASGLEACCIASAIGATVCEYNHLPPWSKSVLNRIRRGAEEVRKQLKQIQHG